MGKIEAFDGARALLTIKLEENTDCSTETIYNIQLSPREKAKAHSQMQTRNENGIQNG